MTALFVPLIFSCNHANISNDKVLVQHAAASDKVFADSLQAFFEESLLIDSIEFNNWPKIQSYKSFLSFKSGYFLNKTQKNALVITCSADTTYTVKLYSVQRDRWVLTDSLNNIGASPPQFDLTFADYNFDEQTDIYIQESASMGWSLSRGHLIIINPNTKKFQLHPETRDFANMEPNNKTRTIETELSEGYRSDGKHRLTIFTNKWIDGRLVPVSKKNVLID